MDGDAREFSNFEIATEIYPLVCEEPKRLRIFFPFFFPLDLFISLSGFFLYLFNAFASRKQFFVLAQFLLRCKFDLSFFEGSKFDLLCSLEKNCRNFIEKETEPGMNLG